MDEERKLTLILGEYGNLTRVFLQDIEITRNLQAVNIHIAAGMAHEVILHLGAPTMVEIPDAFPAIVRIQRKKDD